MAAENTPNRRPLKSRSAAWADGAAMLAIRTGLTPNAISTIGILFAAAGATAFLLSPSNSLYWVVGALFIQLRLLSNMLDGMVAVEGGKASPTGPLFNEFPDRIEDSLLLIAAGYGAGVPTLGWCAALMAMCAAYIRALGGSLGLPQDFSGPMAKQHRMAALTLGCLLAAAVTDQPVMTITLIVIVAGAAITCVRRLLRIAQTLKSV